MTTRRTPYTAAGIKRVPCTRCGDKAHAQWNICADGPKQYRAICRTCDILLNDLVLKWCNDPDREAKMKRYKERQ